MKVLSLLQPWATLVIVGAKKFECRSWKTNYRGTIIIHASAKKPNRREKVFFEDAPFFKTYIDSMDCLPYGSLIGKVNFKYFIFNGEHLFGNRYSNMAAVYRRFCCSIVGNADGVLSSLNRSNRIVPRLLLLLQFLAAFCRKKQIKK